MDIVAADMDIAAEGIDMKYRFTNYVDISTSADSAQIIQIACGGMEAFRRVKHLFGAFKYFKLGSISLKLVPASTLPVDPLGLSYDADDPQTIDPRDQLNPGLVRITNGEQVYTDLSSLSDEQVDGVYRATMLDPRWSKFMLQSGFRRTASPRFWGVGTAAHTVFPGSMVNIPQLNRSEEPLEFLSTLSSDVWHTVTGVMQLNNGELFRPTIEGRAAGSAQTGLFTTGQRVRMGWLPTDSITYAAFGTEAGEYIGFEAQPQIVPIPEIDVITVFLPKAYKTQYYYRLFISENIYFRGLKNVGVTSSLSDEFGALNEYRPIDVMEVNEYQPVQRKPWVPSTTDKPAGWNSGSGD